MRPKRVRIENNEKAMKLASHAKSENFVTQAIVEGGKLLSQQAKHRPLGQRRSVLDIPDPHGSGVGTEHKNKYPAGILYPPVAKYLSRKTDIAKQKRLSSGLLKQFISCLLMPGRYVGTCI